MKKYLAVMFIVMTFLVGQVQAACVTADITTNACTGLEIFQTEPCGTKIDATTVEWDVQGCNEFILYYGYTDTFNGSSDVSTVTFKWINTRISSTVPYKVMDEDAVTEELEAYDIKFDNSTQYGLFKIPVSKRATKLRAYIVPDNATRCPKISLKGDCY